jgi:glycosyltransferase involved in cell wall biosynthesis
LKILFATLLLPHPYADHASSFTVFKMIRNLSARHEISLVSFVRSEKEREHAEYLKPYCARIETVLLPQGVLTKYRARAKLLRMVPLAVSKSHSRTMKDVIHSIVTRETFDIVQIEYAPMGQYVSEIEDVAAVIDVHDLISISAKRIAENLGLSRRKLESLADSLIGRRYETRLYRQFSKVIAVSASVKDQLLACNPSLSVSVISPGVDIPQTQKSHSPGMGRRLIFMGAMWRYENIEAVLFFYHSVFSRIRNTIPGVTLCVAGGSPSEEIKRLAADPAITITGFVEDLLPYYMESDISIAPMRIGGGVQCKILDAMAAGLPVVTTPQGNEGICAAPAKEIFVADTPETFSDRTIELIEDGELRKTISRNAIHFLRRNFGWGQTIERLESVYNECLHEIH